MAGIVEFDGVDATLEQRRREIDVNGSPSRPFEVQRERALRLLQQNLVDVQRGYQVELNARAALEHFEADRVLAAQGLLVRIDPHVEVVVQQVVIGAIRTVAAAQMIGLGERGRRRLRERRVRASTPPGTKRAELRVAWARQ